MRKLWPLSRQMDQADCGPSILCSCSEGAFIWLQAAINIAACFLKNFTDQNDTAQQEIRQMHKAKKSLTRSHMLS